MEKGIRTSVATALLLVPVALGGSIPLNNLSLEPESRLWVTGTSTVRDYECVAGGIKAKVVASSPKAAASVLAGQKAVTEVAVTIPTGTLDCSNGTMNEHMLKALKASEHGQITFRLGTYDLVASGDGTAARLTGTLELGGVSREISVDASVGNGGEGILRVSGAHELRMSDYDLKAPRLMLGTLRVHDPVMVHFDLYLKG